MTTLTVYIMPDSMMMCMARRNGVVSLQPALPKATLDRRSIDHILCTINAIDVKRLVDVHRI